MKKILVLVRHGETLFNMENRVQGWCDSPLTEKGRQQAVSAGKILKAQGYVFDHAYCSSAERACDTLELISSVPYVRCKDLRERCYGNMEGESRRISHRVPADMRDTFYVAMGGESRAQVQQRVYHQLEQIMQKEDHHTVLAVSHGEAIACMIGMVLKEQADAFLKEHRIENCSMTILSYSDALFHLDKMLYIPETAH
ncbi:MAG: histidine phosphatase family protein [Lactimicrobium sp.]|jgi:broad specificity phosphatase PhoE|uniref:histidine phosphatase family protein n=1 Tax=Lactimicrobium sp. TaxID=2563780 RepID=UPI002F35F2D3